MVSPQGGYDQRGDDRAPAGRAGVLDARPTRIWRRWPRSPCRDLCRRRDRVPRGRRSDTCYVVRSGRARAIREHTDGRSITLATFGPGEIFGELAMFDAERRSATVEAIEETESRWRSSAADMRRLLREPPGHRGQAAGGARPAAAGDQRAADAAVVPDRPEPGRVGAGRAGRRPRSEGAGESDVLITATQTDLAQLAGSSRESASRFLACSSGPAMITQGRGKLDRPRPGARWRGMSTESPRAEEFSAGGVVVRGDRDDRDRAGQAVGRRQPRARPAQGASRRRRDARAGRARARSREETGVTARADRAARRRQYRYERKGRPIDKRVRFFLFEYRSRRSRRPRSRDRGRPSWMPLERGRPRAHL